MRLRLLRRRLTISAPRVAIRSALPWPLRWLALAVVFGFCAAVALWAFEFGKSIAGLDTVSRDELLQLRAEVDRLRAEGQEQQTVAHTAESLLVAERAAKESLMAQVRQLETDNRTLREDLGFFEKLIPAAKAEGLAIRSLQAEVLGGSQDGKPWTQTQPAQGQPLQVKQYRRIEGVLDLPPSAVVKTVTARVLEGSAVRAVQAMTID